MEKPIAISETEIRARLKDLPGWNYANDMISKEFKFKDFRDSLSFVNKLAPHFEEMDHHPDIKIMYSKILFQLQRWDIGGKVTDRDFEVAAEIERKYVARAK